MSRPYYTLASRDPDDGRWYPQFGDYDRAVVVAEQDEYRPNFKARDLKIVTTPSARQSDIDAALAKLNTKG